MRYSPIALVLVLIGLAILWEDGEPDDDPHAPQPLQGDYEESRVHMAPAQPPMPELPVYDPHVDDPEFRARNTADDYELHEEIARDLAGGTANLDVDDIRNVLNADDDLPGAGDPAITARRLLATLNRRQQQLGLVERLLDQVLPEIAAAQESGDDEREAWLDQTRGRLETRRDAIAESIAEMADVSDDVLASNEGLRAAIEEIRSYQPRED